MNYIILMSHFMMRAPGIHHFSKTKPSYIKSIRYENTVRCATNKKNDVVYYSFLQHHVQHHFAKRLK